jgi:predicted phosphodiesterase
MNKKTYKEEYILKHGEAAYNAKLAKNAVWRKTHSGAMEIYAKQRSMKGSRNNDRVYFVGDVHLGASSVDEDKIKTISKKYWRGKPLILMGDLCDLGLDRGMNWDNKLGPQIQVDMAEEIFASLNVVAYTDGNHQNRIFQKVGLTPFVRIFGMKSSNEITINKRSIYFNHGRSAAENFFLEFQKIVKWNGSDVLALGHSHDLARITFLRGDKLQHLVRTGSFLGRPKYVVDAAFAPKITGWAEYSTGENRVYLKAVDLDTEEVFDI